MSEQQHVPIEDLAAYAAGDLDAAAAVTVEAHVVLCAECRSDVEAVKAATAALAEVPPVTMPAAVAARLDAALAAEHAPARGGDVLPMAPRRRRPSWSGAAAAAACLALLGGLAIPFVTGGANDGGGTGGSATAERNTAADAVQTRRLASGLDYSRGDVAATLDRALAGVTTQAFSDSAGAPEATVVPPAAAPTPMGANAPGRTSTTSVAPLRTDPGRLAACLTEVSGDLPAGGRTPLVVDFARFMGREALVLVFPSFTNAGAPREGRVDVFVVGGGCGVDPGGDVLDYQRIARPRV